MEDELKEAAELLGSKAKSIQEAVDVEVEADIKGEGEVELEFALIKTGGKWYIASIED